MSAFVDMDVPVRHLTGDPLRRRPACVLESFYEAHRDDVARALRSLIGFKSIVCVDPPLLLRSVEVYETDRVDFADAYLVACGESTGISRIASFDCSIDRVDTVERVEPPPV